MSFLTGKPSTQQQSSQSSNVNNGLITGDYSGTIGAGNNATNFLQSLLTGQGDTGAANAGYQNFLQTSGYQPAMTQLSRGVTGQGAAAGLLNSGATAQALQTKGTQLNQQFYQNYLQNLSGLSGLGLQAGGLVANTGQQSSSQGTSSGSTPGWLGTLASVAGGVASAGKTAGIFSDRRLKTAIRKVGEFADGLGIYTFRYIGQSNRIRGVMADEVKQLRPWALGRSVAGFATVNYGAL